ncbi:MAG TPA: ester cyclase [Rubrobacter sp.]|nr:ester cyclase [Rubrobacter sp.]
MTLARRFIEEVHNGRDLDVVDELCHPDHTFHHWAIPEEQSGGLDVVKRMVSLFYEISPDFMITITDEIVREDKTASLWAGTGLLREDLRSAGSPEEQINLTGAYIHRIEDDKIIETSLVLDGYRNVQPGDQVRITRIDGEDLTDTEIKLGCCICPRCFWCR